MGKVLKKEVRDHLINILDMTPGALAARISEIKRDYYGVTPTAAAQLLAKKHSKSIQRFLNDEDIKSLAGTNIPQNIPMRSTHKSLTSYASEKIILSFSTEDHFIQRHIKEINKTYNVKCYTATFILCRKVMENLIIDILRKKFPKERGIYEDTKTHRYLDFSVVLDNLYKRKNKFNTRAHNAIDRLKQKATPFKKDANNKTHSLFHIATKGEIDNAEVQLIFDLIVVIMQEVDI